MGILTNVARKIFGTATDRMLKTLWPEVERINVLEPDWRKKTDGELRASTEVFRKRLHDGEKLDNLLPEAFAAVREAGRRFLGTRHYDVQLIGGMVLHRGMIAEMVTGEGKTLVATLAAYLNALEGKGVHVVTVNDYLAQRDCDWMAPIYRGLGLTVGAIQSNMSSEERHPNYDCDITYGTNNEFGFDYLRDNMKTNLSRQVQGPLNFAIVDEVDSILIDEARTPLIISGSTKLEAGLYREADRVVRALGKPDKQTLENKYFKVEEKDHRVDMTEEGQERVSELLGIDNIWSGTNMQWPHLIANALKAHHLYKKEQHYTLKDGAVVIVDEFTGRIMEGRRWSDGLHQAVEAKEERDGTGVKIKEESVTMASITLQNYFRLYSKLAGMTGTAMTEASEFDKIYRLGVVDIPTNRPLIRHRHDDLIFGTDAEKYQALADEIAMVSSMGRPVLVGTTSIERSEELSKLLNKNGFKLEQQTRALGDYKRHYVLNARVGYENQYREADIVAQAGRRLVPEKIRDDLEALSQNARRADVEAVLEEVTNLGHQYKSCPGMVIIATNMAGRGTDILLGGNAAHFFYNQLLSEQAMNELKHEQAQKKKKGKKGGDDGAVAVAVDEEEEVGNLFSEMHELLTQADALSYPMKDPRTLENPKERDGTQRALAEEFLNLLKLTPDAFDPEMRETYGSLFRDLFDPEHYVRFFGDASTWTDKLGTLLERSLSPSTDLVPAKALVADLVRLCLPVDTYITRKLEIMREHALKEGRASGDIDEVVATLGSPEWRARLRKAEEMARDCLFNRLLVLSPQFFLRKPLGLLPNQSENERTAPYWFRSHESGGLHIVGTERHESRRIDDQLRGRCGRQGDPGSSQFFLCLEDDLMRIFAGESMRKLLTRFGLRDGNPIQHRWVSGSVEKAQRKVETRNFEKRKNLLEYDTVMDAQRKSIYTKRQCVLEGLTEETNPLRFRALRIRRSALEDLGGFDNLDYDTWYDWWRNDQQTNRPLAEGDAWEPLPPKLREEHLNRSSLEMILGQVSRMVEEYADPEETCHEWDLHEFVNWFNSEFAEFSEPISVEQLEAMPLKDIKSRLREQVLWQKDPNLEEIAKETAKMRRHDIVPYAKETFAQKYEITFDEDAMTAIEGADPKKASEVFTNLYRRNVEERREREVGRDRMRAVESRLNAATSGWDVPGLCRWVYRVSRVPISGKELDGKEREEVEEYLQEKIRTHYEEHEKEMGAHLMRFIEQYVMLQTIDSRWKDHLREMDYLRSAVAFSGYVQRDPKVEYKIRGFDNFQQMQGMIESEYTEKVFRARLVDREQLESLAGTWTGATARKDAAGNDAEAAAGGDGTSREMDRTANQPQGQGDGPVQIRNKYREPGPNDPCPCGSGKKWKKCHMVGGGIDALPDKAKSKLLVH